MEKLQQALKEQQVFVTLDAVERQQFKSAASCLKLKAGETIFREEESPSFVCLIESGHVKICRSSLLGDIVTVGVRGTGDLIGVAEVLCETQRCCFAEALENCELWRLDGKAFRAMLYTAPVLAVKVATALGTRLREAETTILNLVTLEVDRRLARLLVSLADKGVTTGQKGLRIDIRLKQQEIAMMIGTCRQTVTTTLQRLKKEGLIYTGKERIEIVDMDGLKSFAGL